MKFYLINNLKVKLTVIMILITAGFVKETFANSNSYPPLLWVMNSIEAPEVVEKRYLPLISYLSKQLDRTIEFKVSRTYQHGNQLFESGEADIGVLGPSPFVKLQQSAPNAVEVLATMENNHAPHFYGVIVTRKDSSILDVSQLQDTRFAFGSVWSTLAFYSPAYSLLKNEITPSQLKKITYLPRHDVVANHVIMGRSDAGGIKSSVANKYRQYLKVIATSEPIRDHAIVAASHLSSDLKQRIRSILLDLKDPAILKSVKPSLTGFLEADNQVYDGLKPMMRQVDEAYNP